MYNESGIGMEYITHSNFLEKWNIARPNMNINKKLRDNKITIQQHYSSGGSSR